MTKRWTAECDNAAVLAKAIFSGSVTDKLETFKKFFDPDGPGAYIGVKYDYHTPKGKRNLQLNWRKLVKKIKAWQTNKPDPVSGKRKLLLHQQVPVCQKKFLSFFYYTLAVRFSESFKAKAGFPKRPKLLSDVPLEDQGDFVAGRDQIFEEIVKETRKEEDSNSDGDSLTVVEAGIETEDNSITDGRVDKEEQEAWPTEEQDTFEIDSMPARIPPSKEPGKTAGQCEVSWEVLKPVIALCTVQDPDMLRRNATLPRTGVILRVDIPAGVVLTSFQPEITADGHHVVFTCHMDQSRFDATYTLGRKLGFDKIKLGMEKALNSSWSFVKDKCDSALEGGGVIRDYKRYVVKLPEKCERDFRDPGRNWDLNYMGVKGCTMNCHNERSLFYYVFLFTEKSKDVTPARASVNNIMHMDQTYDSNPMNATNLARDNYDHQMEVAGYTPRRSDRKKSRHRSKSRRRERLSPKADFISSLAEMSIDDDSTIATKQQDQSSRKSRRRRERKSAQMSETESMCRDRLKGKLRRYTAGVEQFFDKLNKEELEIKLNEMGSFNMSKEMKEFEEQRAELERAR